ncbi:MAG: ABC transporter ATP-binding protein [Candidatus Eisenbacteria bacterium]|uniref:ABC transporter ATP-binding protein n=1 Tax=Eiseniibacteriota bacterium TaxID=2212470 RepID=A0A9D6L5M0_UNCEI|nr:ABC transporter ATP-binding protein [Candidatus Eisenbacteria bacterium]MBI3540267.1 ABC transporter ATP-binding protein [Candidatus Eisenbacteria bacterium]
MAGIEVIGLTKTYRRGLGGETVRALTDVSLAIPAGEAFGIIGPNGAGKTTFLGCLLGFLRPDAGRITIDGHAPDDLAVRAATGYLPERLILDRWMTGGAFLAYHHALARLPEASRRADVDAALEQVALSEARAQRVREYSRGMLQRLGLAQALLGAPRYVFLDEPASGVDPAGVVLFRRLLSDLKRRAVTVILNSHQLDQVERVCDRVAFVRAGRVEAIETISAGATVARVLRVRAAGAPIGERIAREALAAIATQAGAELRQVTAAEARFAVADDAGAARLIAALVAGGVAVAEATPEESRLERLFLDAPGATGATP